jgi:hypothetical protein
MRTALAASSLPLLVAVAAIGQPCGPEYPLALPPAQASVLVVGAHHAMLDEPDVAAHSIPSPVDSTATDDAYVAIDRNLDGMIDRGAELFGSDMLLQNGKRAANGFLALMEFDDNRDGIIDSADAIWPYLVLWRDTNRDGVSQPWELASAADDGWVAMSLQFRRASSSENPRGFVPYESQAWTVDGEHAARLGWVYEVLFSSADGR